MDIFPPGSVKSMMNEKPGNPSVVVTPYAHRLFLAAGPTPFGPCQALLWPRPSRTNPTSAAVPFPHTSRSSVFQTLVPTTTIRANILPGHRCVLSRFRSLAGSPHNPLCPLYPSRPPVGPSAAAITSCDTAVAAAPPLSGPPRPLPTQGPPSRACPHDPHDTLSPPPRRLEWGPTPAN